jgi:septal ring factor EnvC (AmiA/AmiB activator)
VGDESATIRIGDGNPKNVIFNACFIQGISGVAVTGDSVFVNAEGRLGVAPAGHPLSMKEMLKERQVVQQLKATTEKQAARIALQENQIQTLTAALKQQAEQIQKVSAQLEMIRPAPRVVENR